MQSPLSGRVSVARLFCLLFALGLAPTLQAAETGPERSSLQDLPASGPVGVSGEATEPGNAAADVFDLQLDAPEPLRVFLLRHLELPRYRRLAELDSGELDRLLQAAPDNLRQLLGTQGHFSPQLSVAREVSAAAAEATPPLGRVRIRVDPGPLTRVASSRLSFSGALAGDADAAAAAQRAAAEAVARQPIGQPFSQALWERTKAETVRLLASERYPRARIVNSLSDIDALNQAAHWHLELDTGAPVRIGPVRVEGASRYDPVTVERLVRLAGLRPGSDYSLSRLQDAQQKVADSGLYTSVFAYVDLEAPTASDGGAPVVVQVREAPLQRVVLGVGGSTNNGPRLSVEHQHLRLPGVGWQALSKLQWERTDQQLSSNWTAPIEDDGWHWLAGGRLTRQVDDDTTLSGLRLSAGRSQERARTDRRYFVQYDRSRSVNRALGGLDAQGSEAALSANYGWTWRRFDQLPYPQSGFGLGLTLGVGSTLGNNRQPFASVQGRWLGYWSLDPLPGLLSQTLGGPGGSTASSPSARLGRLALRLQGGAVLADTGARIPDTQLFLTGGDTTVRGYGLRDIGVPQSDGSVAPGRYLAVASFEWLRPVWRDNTRTDWETVLFADAGLVTNQPSQTSPKLGFGAGLRYNSPVGPLQLDLAYGVDRRRLRLHLNVGFSF